MNIRLKCEQPNDILYTLTVTMTAGEWDKLRDQLDTCRDLMSYPAYDLRMAITDLLAQARKVYYTRPTPEAPND